MKIAEINMVDYGSTGKIMLHIADNARRAGHVVRTFSKKWKRQTPPNTEHAYFGTTLENGIHVFLSQMVGYQGLFSYFGTKQLVHELEKYQPDIVHLHNLHDSCLCLPILFNYLKEKNISVVWTFHDCWAMTGQCHHFIMAKCNKWKTGCYCCPQLTAKLPMDCSAFMWKHKQKWFNGIRNMIIVTPSQWLASLVGESFLQDYPVHIINNGIDLSVFRPRQSNFRDDYGIGQEKFVLLGVAFGWGVRKGLDVFVELARKLDMKQYQIVLVGTDDTVDAQLPPSIISIHRTQNQDQLAEIYTAADLFVNPTREDSFPTTNMESLACGTPVVTYRTGGSPEIIDASSGSVTTYNDVDQLSIEIERIRKEKPFLESDCINRAGLFDKDERYKDYIRLFESLA